MTVARVVPRLHLALVCADVEVDGNGRAFKLVEPLYTISATPRPDGSLPAPPIGVFAQLAGENAFGTFWLVVEARDARGRPLPGRYRTPAEERTFTSGDDPQSPTELWFPLPGLVFPAPGAYDLYVMCNHLSLHALDRAPPPCRVWLVPAEPGTG